MYIAIDDTDSTRWMCTTYLATELVASLPEYDLIGLPRLVRLNPAVPWKTRGNGAICLRFGRGSGSGRKIGEIAGKAILSFSRIGTPADPDDLMETGFEILSRWSRVSEGASPGLVVSTRKPSQALYWSAVREIVDREKVLQVLSSNGSRWKVLEGGRGIVGASAAMAWRPRDRTYELLAYRARERWGTGRDIDTDSIIEMDRLFPSTFNNLDPVGGKPAIAPNSPCPVLYGIRGDSPDDLMLATRTVNSEPVDRYLLFLTNQGTDDHIIRRWTDLLPNRSYSIKGTVTGEPRHLPGGHVVLTISTRRGELECTAYEPSKRFRGVARALSTGDVIQVMGELREEPRTLNVEKIQVISLSGVMEKKGNPTCPGCGRRMKSTGRGTGFRCRSCGSRAGESEAEWAPVERDLEEGWYEPPVPARRHLSKPLKRGR